MRQLMALLECQFPLHFYIEPGSKYLLEFTDKISTIRLMSSVG